MVSDTALIEDILALPPIKKAEIAEHVERLKHTNGSSEKTTKPRRPPAGSDRELFKIMPGFDDPIPGLEEYM